MAIYSEDTNSKNSSESGTPYDKLMLVSFKLMRL